MTTTPTSPDIGAGIISGFHVKSWLTNQILANCDTRSAATEFADAYENEHGPATTYIAPYTETHHVTRVLRDDTDPAALMHCLYCGSTDVYETRVTVDDRTEEMAMACGSCHGVWAP